MLSRTAGWGACCCTPFVSSTARAIGAGTGMGSSANFRPDRATNPGVLHVLAARRSADLQSITPATLSPEARIGPPGGGTRPTSARASSR